MDNSGQTISSITYDRVTTSSTPTQLAAELKSSVANNRFTNELFLNLTSNAVAQVDTFTISGTLAVDDVITVTIEDADGNEFDYIFKSKSTNIQAAGISIASLINLDDDVTASSSFSGGTATVTIRSATPGRAFTTTTGKTGTVTVGAASTTTPSSGTAMKRKVGQAEWLVGVSDDGSVTVTGTVRFYDAASSPTQVQSQNTASYKHPRTIDAVRTAQGA